MWIHDIHWRPSPITAAHAELRRQRQPRQDAAVAPEHQPDAQVHDANALRLGRVRRGFALDAELRLEYLLRG